MSFKSFLHGKLVAPIILQLKQGITPHKLALSLATGFVLGCIPIIGPITPLCVFVAFLFRLNHVAIQVANYAAYPLQIAMLIPFYRMGEKIFGIPPIPLNVQEILNTFQESFSMAIEKYLMTGLRGVVAWLIVSPFAFVMIYKLSFIFLKKVMKNEYNS
jgi:uncharacterized protein (DUF2062 family)